MKNLSMLFLLVFLCFLAACSSTTVVYDVNNYETGKVLKESEVFGINYSNTVSISSLVLSPEITSNEDFKKTTFYNSQKGMASVRLRPKLNARTRLMLSCGIGDSSSQVKGYLKYMLSDPDSDFGLSVMPGFGYSSGGSTTLSFHHLDVRSRLLGLEFLIPMSYTFTEFGHITFGPKFYSFSYSVPCEFVGDVSLSKTFSEHFFSPGISAGVKYRFLNFETTALRFKDETKVVFGLGAVF